MQADTPEFLVRVKRNNQRALLEYDNRLASLHAVEDIVDRQISAAILSGKHDQVDKFVRTKAKISESISDITASQLNLANAMTADMILELDKGVKKDG